MSTPFKPRTDWEYERHKGPLEGHLEDRPTGLSADVRMMDKKARNDEEGITFAWLVHNSDNEQVETGYAATFRAAQYYCEKAIRLRTPDDVDSESPQ